MMSDETHQRIVDANLQSGEFFQELLKESASQAGRFLELHGIPIPEISENTLGDSAIRIATARYIHFITSDTALSDPLEIVDSMSSSDQAEQAARLAYGYKKRRLDNKHVDVKLYGANVREVDVESVDPLLFIAKGNEKVFSTIVDEAIRQMSMREDVSPEQWSKLLYGLDLIITSHPIPFSNTVGELDEWNIKHRAYNYFRELIGERKYHYMHDDFIADIIGARTHLLHAMMQHPSREKTTEILVSEQREKIKGFVGHYYTANNPSIGFNKLPTHFRKIIKVYSTLAGSRVYDEHDAVRQALLVDFLNMAQFISEPLIKTYPKKTLVNSNAFREISESYFEIIEKLNVKRKVGDPSSDYAVQLSTISSGEAEMVPKPKDDMDLLQMLLSLQKGNFTLVDLGKKILGCSQAKNWRDLTARFNELSLSQDKKDKDRVEQFSAITQKLSPEEQAELQRVLSYNGIIEKARQALVGWTSAFERITGAKTPNEVLEILLRDLALGTVGLPALIDLAKLGLLPEGDIIKEAQKITGSPALDTVKEISVNSPFQKFLQVLNINPSIFTLGGRKVGIEQIFPMYKDLVKPNQDGLLSFNPETFRSLGEIDASLISDQQKRAMKLGFKTYTEKLFATLDQLDSMNANYASRMGARFIILTYFSTYPGFWDVEKKLKNSKDTLDTLLGIDECRVEFVYRLLRERMVGKINDKEWNGMQQYIHARYPDSSIARIMSRLPAQYMVSTDSFRKEGTLPIALEWLDNAFWINKEALSLIRAKAAYLKSLANVSMSKVKTESPKLALIHLINSMSGYYQYNLKELRDQDISTEHLEYPRDKTHDRTLLALDFPFRAIKKWEDLGWKIPKSAHSVLKMYIDTISGKALIYLDETIQTDELDFNRKNITALEALELYQRLLEAEKVEHNANLDRLVNLVISINEREANLAIAELSKALNDPATIEQLAVYRNNHGADALLSKLNSIDQNSRWARMRRIIESKQDYEFTKSDNEAKISMEQYFNTLQLAREVLKQLIIDFSNRRDVKLYQTSLDIFKEKLATIEKRLAEIHKETSLSTLKSSVQQLRTTQAPTQ